MIITLYVNMLIILILINGEFKKTVVHPKFCNLSIRTVKTLDFFYILKIIVIKINYNYYCL